ncbi:MULTISPECIES: helix-turn-helix domain-containing protein [Prauserella salsuginis group]|uniref:AraC-like DNA-binding protein n=2 Tax=Prauserella salsuginis group TaxID=2893672 RepID=A0A839XR70_9PSEU|nr:MULTISPECIES: helix-turn-helix domain-containing protein [Prauserella salsuginis group]MBB3665700.1 AraC-like DNA-binding protein [Prauserella sediminis]MCR3722892.1 transcriptional regulator, AraC family [Prauserella flava]MCR3737433.1 transcriptional regulator, AraC family [Prauserella salsuginis]
MTVHGLTRFHTGDVPERRRLAAWEEHNVRSLVGLRARPLGQRPFTGTELNLSLSRLRLAKVTGSPHVVERGPGQIATSPGDGVVVYFALSGQGAFHHREGRVVLSPGQALVCDADQPFRRDFSRGLTELVLAVPRGVLREATGRSGLARPRTIGIGSPHGRALASLVAGGLRGETDWDALESRVVELLPAVVGSEPADGGHLAAAHAYIAAHLADPELSAGRIARAVGVSERQLSRLFAAAGDSVPRTVLAARLDAARAAVTDPATRGRSLAELAACHGFASQAHFSRSYRARFGTTPLRDRREAARD